MLNERDSVNIKDILANYGTVIEDEPMKYHTSIRIGGKVKYYITPDSIESLLEVIHILKDNNEKFMFLGRGSNTIFPDYDMDLSIISIRDTVDYIDIDGEEIRVGAGYGMQKLAKKSSKLGLSGLEFAGGIPGTIGGCVYMNAGAHTQEIKDVVKYVKTMDCAGVFREYTNAECDFSYRHSIFQELKDEVIIEVGLKLEQQDPAEVFKRMSGNLAYRKELQPIELPSCGSVFKNPPNHHAGILIEEAGLKGHRIGGAEISNKHANFIVNIDEATSEDVMQLRQFVIDEIKKKFDIELTSEIKILEGIDAR